MGIKDRVISAVLGAAASAAWDAIKNSNSDGAAKGQMPNPSDVLPSFVKGDSLESAVASLKGASGDSAWSDAFSDAFSAALSGTEAKDLHAALVEQARAKREVMEAGANGAAEARKAQEISLFKRKSAEESWKRQARQLVHAVNDFKGTLDAGVKSSVIANMAELAATDKVARAPAAEKDPEGWAAVHGYAAKRESLNELTRALSKR